MPVRLDHSGDKLRVCYANHVLQLERLPFQCLHLPFFSSKEPVTSLRLTPLLPLHMSPQQDIVPAVGLIELSANCVQIGSFVILCTLAYIFDFTNYYIVASLLIQAAKNVKIYQVSLPSYQCLFVSVIGTVSMRRTQPKMFRPRFFPTGPLAGTRGHARSTSGR
jgi:hypothetical protein